MSLMIEFSHIRPSKPLEQKHRPPLIHFDVWEEVVSFKPNWNQMLNTVSDILLFEHILKGITQG